MGFKLDKVASVCCICWLKENGSTLWSPYRVIRRRSPSIETPSKSPPTDPESLAWRPVSLLSSSRITGGRGGPAH